MCERRLLTALLGRAVPPASIHAGVAPGFRAVPFDDRPWPVLVRAPGRAAEGLVILGLSPFERDLLDAWEGADYRPAPLPVMIGEELHEAEAYLPSHPLRATGPDLPDWHFAVWAEQHAERAIAAARHEGETLRAKLIALRPH